MTTTATTTTTGCLILIADRQSPLYALYALYLASFFLQAKHIAIAQEKRVNGEDRQSLNEVEKSERELESEKERDLNERTNERTNEHTERY